MAKPNLLILSPVNKGGGVALDVGYLASILKSHFEIKVISLGNFYSDSEVYYFDRKLNYDSLDRLLLKKHLVIRLAANLLTFIKPLAEKKYNRLSNNWFKKYFYIENKRTALLKKLISENENILLCNQLTGKYVEQVCRMATDHNILMRITGQILPNQITTENKIWLGKINTFIHHATGNLNVLQKVLPESNHFLIDQSAYDEQRFLSIPVTSKISRFFTVSRLHELKQVDLVIKAFKNIKHQNIKLTVYGDGPIKKDLLALAADDPRISFFGTISFQEVHKAYQDNDCLIISSRSEAGPYTAIEAMAAGKPIISTRVGAIEDRLGTNYPFFIEQKIESLEKMILKMTNRNPERTTETSKKLRKIYLERYCEDSIAEMYLSILIERLKFSR